MCGICGAVVGPERALPSVEDIRSMVGAMAHRGPDHQGWLHRPQSGFALGYCRLAIVCPGPQGNQPMSNEAQRLHLVFNGEIYNHVDLRRALEARGHAFGGACDGEVILHGYEEEGPGVLDRLQGMFGLALWDGDARRLLLARDRAGEKPLYYSQAPGALAFASEAKALLGLPWVSREVDRDGVRAYLSLSYVPAPLTGFRDVSKLGPGSYLCWTAEGGAKVRPYWRARPGHRRWESRGEAVEAIRDSLGRSVEARLQADVPVGLFLSGGVDSSLVAAMAVERGGPLPTFSVGLDVAEEGRGVNQDLPYARLVASRLGCPHTELRLPLALPLLGLMCKLTHQSDDPLAAPTSISTYLLAQAARERGIKAVLTGDGGDELFAGYSRYAVDRLAQVARAVPGVLSRTAAQAINILWPQDPIKGSFASLLASPSLPLWRRYLLWHGHINEPLMAGLISPAMAGRSLESLLAPALDDLGEEDPTEALMAGDLRLWLADCSNMRADRASMLASLEIRAPMQDHLVVEQALSLPLAWKIRLLEGKVLLKEVAARWLPRSVLTRAKWGWLAPFRLWVKRHLSADLPRLLSREAVERAGFVDHRRLHSLLAQDRLAPFQIWMLLSLHLWHGIHCERDQELLGLAQT